MNAMNEPGCLGRRRLTRDEARAVLASLRSDGSRGRLTAYPCTDGGADHWHVGTPPAWLDYPLHPAVYGPRAVAELLADCERSNRVIAAAAGVSVHVVQKARRRLETAGKIKRWRPPPPAGFIRRPDMAARERVTTELLADCERINRVIAAAAQCSDNLVLAVRHELEDSGLIRAWRGDHGYVDSQAGDPS